MISANLKRKLLIYMTYQFDGDWNKILDELQNPKIKVSRDDLAKFNIEKIPAICIEDDAYLRKFTIMDQPPFVIFYKGNLDLLKDEQRKIGFVFSDNSSLVNTFKVRKVFDRLDKNVSFVTGINNLFDLKTQEEAIRKGRPSIVVLNKGIDYSFDESISSILNATLENNGLILSEYPRDVVPENTNNMDIRLLAALSDSLFLVDKNIDDRFNVAINAAIKYNKPIYSLNPSEDESEINREVYDLIIHRLDNLDTTKEKREYLSSLNDADKKILIDEWGQGAEMGYALFNDVKLGLHIERIDEMGVYDGDSDAAKYALKDGFFENFDFVEAGYDDYEYENFKNLYTNLKKYKINSSFEQFKSKKDYGRDR